MKTVILVAHGCSRANALSVDNIKTITKAGCELSYEEAKNYINNTGSFVEYSSSNFDTFSPIDTKACKEILGRIPDRTATFPNDRRGKFIPTGVKQKITNFDVVILREKMCFAELATALGKDYKIIVAACRTYDYSPL